MANAQQLCEMIQQGSFDMTLGKLYGAQDVEKQRTRYIDALRAFGKQFGAQREVQLYSAPGRTEIGGNHTDHNNGVVMAAAVNLDVLAVVSQNEEYVVRLQSAGFGLYEVDLSQLEMQEDEKETSPALIRGVAACMSARGGKLVGFDAYVTSDVLGGSGLSSSAAFEVALGEIWNGECNGGHFTPVELAQIGQYAENVFFGKPSGLMDQTACAVGSAMTIDFADPEEPVVDKVPFRLAEQGYALCITDTKGSHADLTADYAALRAEMESVAGFFGKKVLREVDEQDFYKNLAAIRAQTGDRAVLRAGHFFAECRRARALCNAVRGNRLGDFLEMIVEGGDSSFEYNQNAYSISRPAEQGVPLGLMISQRVLTGRGAWRLQGGGFGGTIQAFVPMDLLETYRAAVEDVFGEGSCYVLNVRNYGAVPVTADLR